MEMIGVKVAEMSQTGSARRLAANLAERLGFNEENVGRVALVVTEAATNLVKHAREGEIVVCPVERSGANSVLVLALDRGPGIDHPERCMSDGYSTSGTMGSGLGAIRRLSSEFEIYTAASGTIVLSRIGGDPPTRPVGMDAGAIAVPCPGEEVSGDGWAVAAKDGVTYAMVVDGLGHGADAHAASAEAVRAFHEHVGLRPPEILDRIHQRLRPTRGAVAGIVELDPRERLARYSGIGNISGTIVTKDGTKSMVSHHGTLGHASRKPHEFVYPWPEGSLVILHSDGVSAHWDLNRHPGLASRRPLLVAAAIYRDHHRANDDATVLALRESS